VKDFKRESVCENVWHGGPLASDLKGGQQHGTCMEREVTKQRSMDGDWSWIIRCCTPYFL